MSLMFKLLLLVGVERVVNEPVDEHLCEGLHEPDRDHR